MLQAINRFGAMRLVDIAAATSLPYPTVFRLVETLVDAGMVELEPGRRRYRPTALVQTLSLGYRDELALVALARPHIVALCREVGWPVTICTRVGNAMMVRDSTHRLTTLTFNDYAAGYSLPLLECAVGKAHLAWCDPEERAIIISSLARLDSAIDKRARLQLAPESSLLADIRKAGYASHSHNQFSANPGRTSALAVPIHIEGRLAATLGLVFFASAMTIAEAARAYASLMHQTAIAISAAQQP
ncbi:MAG: IclR family transcriptional regulator C-terminal domain-containing protein [Polymorphobacter sp.]|uniref:IclR family transcriptional regulator domain-containing protein n=1 Tax=Polymorphobacter sp. TaxID=1909290 RepID=UPI003A845342